MVYFGEKAVYFFHNFWGPQHVNLLNPLTLSVPPDPLVTRPFAQTPAFIGVTLFLLNTETRNDPTDYKVRHVT